MSAKQAAAWILASLLAILIWLALGACASPRRPQRSAPPPPAPQPVIITRYIESSRASGESARSRVETVVREVEVIKEVVDEASKAKLTEVQAELMRASAELVQLRTDLDKTEAEAKVIVAQAEALRSWGVGQQQVAEANADGWRREEEERRRVEADRDKARAVANKRGNLVGLLGGSSAAFLGLKFMGWFPPYSYFLPLIGAAVGYFAARFIL